MKLEIDNIFFAVCLCLPFLFTPKFLQLHFLGGPIGTELVIWPVLLMYAYTFSSFVKGKREFYRFKYFGYFIVVYFIYSILSLLHGFSIYPYWNLIFNGPVEQIEKLPKVLSFLQIHHIGISKKFLTEFWLTFRLIKAIFLDCFYLFFFSYIVFCWYRKNPKQGFSILNKSITLIIWGICFYSIFELLYFFGFDFGKNVLITINPVLHSIKENFNWWPPLLWDTARVRSFFPEPSQFGMYATFALPFLFTNILNGEHKNTNLLQLFLLSLLLFLSLSKTSNMLLLFALFLEVLYVLVRKNKDDYKKMAVIIAVIIAAFGANILCLSNYSVDKYNHPLDSRIASTQSKSTKLVSSYVNDNVTGVVNPNAGSNNARFSLMRSEIKIFMEHPVLGVGTGLRSAYNANNLMKEHNNNEEVNMWVRLQEKEGVLKSGVPSTCEFTNRLSETGLIGMVIYFFPIFYLFKIIWIKRKNLSKNNKQNNMEICIYISLFCILLSGFSGMLNTTHCYWVSLELAYAFALYRPNEKELGEKK